jgi:hypothetical protein
MPWWDECCHRHGLGELTVAKDGTVDIRRSPVHHALRDLGIRAVLKDAHKDFAPAGNADGKRWSPFQETAQALKAAVIESPGLTLLEFTGDRYQAEKLRRLLKRGAVKGIEVRHGGKCWPEGMDRHSVRGSS